MLLQFLPMNQHRRPMSSNNFLTAIIPQLSSTKAPLPASSLPKTLIAFCLLALISASRASTTPKLPHLLAMEDLLAGVVDPEMEMEVEMMDLQAISSGLGELQVPEPMEMEGPPSSLQEVLQAQEEEETKSGEGANQPGEPHKASRKLLAYAAIARPHLKKISPMPPPLSEEMSRKANEGLGPGPAVHIGTSGLPEFATKPDKRGIYSYFVSTGVKQVFKNLLVSVAALFIGGILETVCLFLLSTLYAMFSSPIQLPGEADCTGESAMEVDGQPLDLRPTPVGTVAIMAFALLETEKEEAFYWNLKVPLPSIIYTAGTALLTFNFNKTRALYNMTKGLWRQPTRRHESVSMELSGRRQEP